MSTETPTGEPWAGYQQSRVRGVVQAANLRTAQSQFFMRTEGRPISVEQARPILAELSTSMGSGGRFFLTGSNHQDLQLTTAIETVPFGDMMSVVRER